MSALFGAAQIQRSKNLVEFKAGKMLLQGKTVKPDKRKGLLYAYQSDDTLMHLCWKDRTASTVEDDLMIFPDDVEIKKVTQCTTGRVYLIRFKSSNKKMFFWMQDPDTEKDEKHWRKLNDCLNNPPAPGSSSMGGSASERSASALSSAFGGDLSNNDLQSLFSSMNEQQIQQLLGISGLMPVNTPTSTSNVSSSQSSRAASTTQQTRTSSSASTLPATTTDETPKPPAAVASTPVSTQQQQAARIQLSDLQNILGNLGSTQTAADNSGTTHVDLAEIVTLDVMAPILANKDVQERLMQYLPEGDSLPKNEVELRNTFTTPQFKRAMYSFSEALQSGQLGPLMHQFNLPSNVSAAAAKGDVEEFAKAMQEHMRTAAANTATKAKKTNENDEEKMDT